MQKAYGDQLARIGELLAQAEALKSEPAANQVLTMAKKNTGQVMWAKQNLPNLPMKQQQRCPVTDLQGNEIKDFDFE